MTDTERIEALEKENQRLRLQVAELETELARRQLPERLQPLELREKKRQEWFTTNRPIPAEILATVAYYRQRQQQGSLRGEQTFLLGTS